MSTWRQMGFPLLSLAMLMPVVEAQHSSSNSVNPYTGPDDAAAGSALYRKQCAGCHGIEGAGTGTGPSLKSGHFQRGSTDEALFQTISKGVAGTTMPAFALSGLQTWQLVTHLRVLSTANNATKAVAAANASTGAELYRKNCIGCHRAGSEGGFAGPSLEGIGARRSMVDLRLSVLQPDAVVPADYWSVDIQTTAGESIRGVRLNEDTSSIQIRDRQGRLHSILRSKIAKVELIRRSPMPAFAGKLSEAEIDHILAHVTTLGGVAAR